MGYSVLASKCDGGITTVQMRLRASLVKALLRRLPEKIFCRVWSENKVTYVYCHPKFSGPQVGVLLLLCLIFAGMYWGGWIMLSGDRLQHSTTRLYVGGLCLLFSLILVFVNFALLYGASQDRLSVIIGRLRSQAVESGTYLAEVGQDVAPGYLIHAVSYLIFAAVTLLSPVALDLLHSTTVLDMPLWGLIPLVLMVLCIALLCITLPIMWFSRGFGLRLIPGLGGICTAISVLVLLCAQVPWLTANGKLTSEYVQRVEDSASFIAGTWQGPEPTHNDGSPVTREEVLSVYNAIRFEVWTYLGGTILFLSLACGFFYLTFRTSVKSLQYLHQMAVCRDIPWSARATQADGFMLRFRLVWLGFWGLISMCLIWGMKHLIDTTVLWLQSGSAAEDGSTLGTIDVSIFMICIAFGTARVDSWLPTLVHGAWFLYLMLCWVLFVLSVGSFFVQEFRGCHAVRSVAAHTKELSKPLTERIRVLCRGACPGSSLQTSVVLVESKVPIARARCLGLFRRQQVVEISTRWLQLLDEEQMDALLAHELAHHTLGHARKDQLFRLLGRLTFFGDAFSRILQDSFDYEIQADRCAVLVFRAKPRALISCLYHMRSIMATETLRNIINPGAMAIESVDTNETMNLLQGLASIPWTRRLKIAMRAYVQQYLGLKYSGYWHPSLQRRIAMLEQLCNSEQFGTLESREPNPPVC